ncbi:MAG: archaeal proteasome endopeptidase complex subunit alpha [Halobacteriaceae archaeon]
MRGQDQQAYDRGSAMFSPDGRIYQVEYAHEAVSQGATTTAVLIDEGIVLAVSKHLDPLLVGESIEKIHKVDDHVGIATTGHVADGRKLVDQAREAAQVHRLRYEEPIPVDSLTKGLTDDIQEHTQRAGTRPYGVSLLVGGVTDGQPALFEADPSGNPRSWRGRAVGDGSEAAQEYLEEEYDPDLGVDGAIELALAALAESGTDLSPSNIDVATIRTDTARFDSLADDVIADYVDAVAEDDDQSAADESQDADEE